MGKFWVFTWFMFNNSNFNRFIFSNTYLPGRKLWVNITNYSCKRCKIFLCMLISSYWAGFILWILYIHTHMNSRSSNFIYGYGYGFLRLCSSMGTNTILRGYRYY